MTDGVMVTQEILVLLFRVRILVGQLQKPLRLISEGLFPFDTVLQLSDILSLLSH